MSRTELWSTCLLIFLTYRELVGLLLLSAFNLPLLPAIVALQFLVGIPASGFSVTHRTFLQASTDERHLGRVLGALNTTNALLTLGGQALASALGDRVGVVRLLNLAGFLYLPGAIVALVMLSGARSPQRPSSSDR